VKAADKQWPSEFSVGLVNFGFKSIRLLKIEWRGIFFHPKLVEWKGIKEDLESL